MPDAKAKTSEKPKTKLKVKARPVFGFSIKATILNMNIDHIVKED